MTRSYALIVRDEIMARIKTMPFFAPFAKFGTNKMEQLQPEHVPFVGVYFISEDLTPDGDADTGEPRFRSSVLYGLSIIVQNNDGNEAEDKLDEAWMLLTDRLFTDPSLYLNKTAQIQSYTRGNRTHQFGSVGAENSIPIAECRFTLTIDLGTIDFPPVVDNVLAKVHFETRYPGGADPNQIQQVIAEWDLPVTKEKADESVSEE
jgi:hypothetical protein